LDKEMKKLLLVQPGAYGDIFVCAPIAKWYADKGYEVHWPVREQFIPTLEYFDYVKPIILSDESLHSDWLRSDVMKILPMFDDYDKVLNLADRGPHSTAQRFNENFELCKYRLAEVPFDEKNKLSWTRNYDKELSLFNHLELTEDEPYVVAHNTDSRNEVATIPDVNYKIVEVKPIDGYNIPDWYLVFQKAKELYCIESSVHQFLDGVVFNLSRDRYLLKRPVVETGHRFTVSTNWKLDFIGKDSVIKG
tara:strand:+ start:5514 stop:6260 length:747 start_codon:yes stop_codon:yes gene_type:complete